MSFGLLGPLFARADGDDLPIQAGKQRALLAMLLLNPGRVVSVDELADCLWGTRPPASARVSIQNYVKRLRRALASAGRPLISTRAGGYLIVADDADIDVWCFEALLGEARTAALGACWDTAAGRAAAALALWRGEPLVDAGSELLAQQEVPRLAEMRLQAVETSLDAGLRLGRQAAAISELRRLTRVHPLRERMHALLMLALYQDGQQAAALACYRAAREVLVSEAGVEPGAELTMLHQRILAADPLLAMSREIGDSGPATGAGRLDPASPLTPRQLPSGIAHFAGRIAEIRALEGLLAEAHEREHPLIIAISGTAGVGKTALAVQWAHRVAWRFPDGQLYVNLHGFSAAGRRMTEGEALSGFLAALRVPRELRPTDVAGQAALFRSLLAGQRMLILIDNARDSRDVRPLLPATAGCLTLVTSRDQLTGLVTAEGALPLTLDVLRPPEARELLAGRMGRDRVAVDPRAVDELIESCARLPLALNVVAARATCHPGLPLAGLLAELRGTSRQLDALATGDAATSVRTVLSWSYKSLTPAGQRMFRRLGFHPGTSFTPEAAASLIGLAPGSAAPLLDELTGAHLLTRLGPSRFTFHDLLRAYARELAESSDEDAGRCTALAGLLDHYLAVAATAMDALAPAERHRRPMLPVPVPGIPPMPDATVARAWLDTERATLVALTALAAAEGFPGHAIRLAAILFRYLDNGGHHQDAVTVHSVALAAAQETGDLPAQASALLRLGGGGWRLGRFDEATAHLEESLALFGQAGDQIGEARALSNLGVIDSCRGDYGHAAERQRAALGIFRLAGECFGQARALESLGIALFQQGFPELATRYQREALAMYRQLGERHGEATVLDSLGVAEWHQRRYTEAAAFLTEAVAVYHQDGDHLGQAHALTNLGAVECWQGRYTQAVTHLRAAIARFREIGDRAGEAGALNACGVVLSAAGEPGSASVVYRDALQVAIRADDRDQQACAHRGLADSLAAVGDEEQARHQWRLALAIDACPGTPEAGQLHARLNELEQPEAASGLPA